MTVNRIFSVELVLPDDWNDVDPPCSVESGWEWQRVLIEDHFSRYEPGEPFGHRPRLRFIEWAAENTDAVVDAADTLDMLRRVRWFLMTKARRDPEERKIVAEINETITKAETPTQ